MVSSLFFWGTLPLLCGSLILSESRGVDAPSGYLRGRSYETKTRKKNTVDDTHFEDEPDIVKIRRTGVTLRLFPIRRRFASDLLAYYVVVECHNAYQNRTLLELDTMDYTLNHTSAKRRRQPLYAARKFEPSELSHSLEVVIGNDATYGLYSNPKLDPDSQYRFGIAAEFPEDRYIYKPSSRTIIPRQSDRFYDDPYTVWLLFTLLIIIFVLLVVIVLHLDLPENGWCRNLSTLWGASRRRQSLFEDSNGTRNRNRLTLLTATAYEVEEDDQSTFVSTTSESKGFEIKRHPVSASEFSEYVKTMVETDGLKQEFASVPRGQWFKWDVARLPENRGKNRYGNLLAYDHNRVVLALDDEENEGDMELLIAEEDSISTDYINASFVDGYKTANRYIATQGPLANTVADFWRMVWQTKSNFIVMLTNVEEVGKMKCDKYWPDETAKYGCVVVRLIKTETFDDYIIRKFSLSKKGHPNREVLQYHYVSWPDHTIPLFTTSVMSFIFSMRKCPGYKEKEKPIIAHCSAGVGRTGTFIMIDTLLEKLRNEKSIDVLAQLCVVRSQRINMVEKLQQYVFVHQFLAEVISKTSSGKTTSEEL